MTAWSTGDPSAGANSRCTTRRDEERSIRGGGGGEQDPVSKRPEARVRKRFDLLRPSRFMRGGSEEDFRMPGDFPCICISSRVCLLAMKGANGFRATWLDWYAT